MPTVSASTGAWSIGWNPFQRTNRSNHLKLRRFTRTVPYSEAPGLSSAQHIVQSLEAMKLKCPAGVIPRSIAAQDPNRAPRYAAFWIYDSGSNGAEQIYLGWQGRWVSCLS